MFEVAPSAPTHMFWVLPLALYHILGAKSFTNTCSRWHLLHRHTCSGCCLLHCITFWVSNPSLTHVRGGTFCTDTHVLGAAFRANMHVVGATFCISAHVLGSCLLPSAPTHMSWVLTSALVNTHVLVLYSALVNTHVLVLYSTLTHMFCVLATFCTS